MEILQQFTHLLLTIAFNTWETFDARLPKSNCCLCLYAEPARPMPTRFSRQRMPNDAGDAAKERWPLAVRQVQLPTSVFSESALAGLIVAGELGFEPRLTESESAVLPLNYSPKRTACQRVKRSPSRRICGIVGAVPAAIYGKVSGASMAPC